MPTAHGGAVRAMTRPGLVAACAQRLLTSRNQAAPTVGAAHRPRSRGTSARFRAQGDTEP